MSTSPKRVGPPKADDTWLSPKNDISHLITNMTPDKRVENPEKEYLDRIMNQMAENLEKTSKVPYMTTDKVEEIVEEFVENYYSEGNEGGIVFSTGFNGQLIEDWLHTTLTQYHQDLMSEVVEKLRKASYFASFGWKEQPESFKSMQSPDVKKQIIDFTEAQDIIKSK